VDGNGNLTADTAGRTESYSFDERNHLALWQPPGWSDAYYFDALGRRSYTNANGIGIQYLHDGQNVVREQYSIGTQGYSEDGLLGVAVNDRFTLTGLSAGTGTLQTLLTDARNSTIAAVSPGGALGAQYSYEPFGTTA